MSRSPKRPAVDRPLEELVIGQHDHNGDDEGEDLLAGDSSVEEARSLRSFSEGELTGDKWLGLQEPAEVLKPERQHRREDEGSRKRGDDPGISGARDSHRQHDDEMGQDAPENAGDEENEQRGRKTPLPLSEAFEGHCSAQDQRLSLGEVQHPSRGEYEREAEGDESVNGSEVQGFNEDSDVHVAPT